MKINLNPSVTVNLA